MPGAGFASTGISQALINTNNSNLSKFTNYIEYGDPIGNLSANYLYGKLGLSMPHYGNVINIGNNSLKQKVAILDWEYGFKYHYITKYESDLLYNGQSSYSYIGGFIKFTIPKNWFTILGLQHHEDSSSISSDPIIIYQDTPAVTNLSDSSTYYAYDGKTEQRTAWVAGGYNNSSFLVKLDSSGNPILLTANDLTAMEVNGIIDSSNSNWDSLYLWSDNGDGKLESGELTSLANSGISSISTQLTTINQDENGSTLVSSGTVTMTDGTTEIVGDINLATDSTYTITQKDQELSAGTLSTTITTTNTDGTTSTIDLTTLPDFHGYGVLSSPTVTKDVPWSFCNDNSDTSYYINMFNQF